MKDYNLYAAVQLGDVIYAIDNPTELSAALGEFGRTSYGINQYDTGVVKAKDITKGIEGSKYFARLSLKSGELIYHNEATDEDGDEITCPRAALLTFRTVIRLDAIKEVIDTHYDALYAKIMKTGLNKLSEYTLHHTYASDVINNGKKANMISVRHMEDLFNALPDNGKFADYIVLSETIVSKWKRSGEILINKRYAHSTLLKEAPKLKTHKQVEKLLSKVIKD